MGILKEVWKDIPGYEAIYAVSNLGRIKSIARFAKHWRGGTQVVRERILKTRTNRYGYIRVGLWKNGIKKTYRVHRLVLDAYVGPCPAGKQCAHDDGARGNNNLSNLMWKTPKQNQADRVRHGTSRYGAKNPNSLFTNAQVREIRRRYVPRCAVNGAAAIAREFAVTRQAISRITRSQGWIHI